MQCVCAFVLSCVFSTQGERGACKRVARTVVVAFTAGALLLFVKA